MILDIAHKYSLRNSTNFSAFIFSEIVVNQAISEKKIDIFLFSQSSFKSQLSVKILFAISLEIYSLKAFTNIFLFLFSIKNLTKLEKVNHKNNHNIISTG
jgi:hypothetical protein